MIPEQTAKTHSSVTSPFWLLMSACLLLMAIMEGAYATPFSDLRGSFKSSIPTVRSADINQHFTVTITPETNPKSDPHTGSPVILQPMAAGSGAAAAISAFLAPVNLMHSMSETDSYYQGKGNGPRRPSKQELSQLFLDAKSPSALVRKSYMAAAPQQTKQGVQEPLLGKQLFHSMIQGQ